MSEAIELLSIEFGMKVARQLCFLNPAMLLPTATAATAKPQPTAPVITAMKPAIEGRTPFDAISDADLDRDV